MATNTEAQEIYAQAVALWDDNPDDTKVRRDAAGLLQLAIKKAGGCYPDAEAALAWSYLLLGDDLKARSYASQALRSDPHSWQAQEVLVLLAAMELPGFFAKRNFKAEFVKLTQIFLHSCQEGISDTYFAHCADRMMLMADRAESDGVGKLVFVYQTIASVPLAKIVHTSDDAMEKVKKLHLIAEARAGL